MQNIALLGFGRSGTTWVSDIISKVTGTLILFEPLHPSVTELSEKFAYSEVTNTKDSKQLKEYFDAVLSKRHRKMWLLRNHVPVPLDKVSEAFLETIWDECRVTGFKAIRGNSMVDWFHNELGSKVVFVVRHPCAVVASIKRRSNFWEFGWPRTYELFLSKTVYNGNRAARFKDIVESVDDDLGKCAVMWAVTHAIAIEKLDALGLPIFYYEDLYREPFRYVREMFEYIGDGRVDIHPSHMFTPSMTTMRTVHGLYDKEGDIADKGASAFWEKDLTERDVDMVMELVRSFGVDLYGRDGHPLRSR